MSKERAHNLVSQSAAPFQPKYWPPERATEVITKSLSDPLSPNLKKRSLAARNIEGSQRQRLGLPNIPEQ